MAKQTDANIFDFKKIKDEMVAISDEVSKSLLKGIEDGTDPVTKKQKEVAREIEELKQKGLLSSEKEQKEFLQTLLAEEAATKIRTQEDVAKRAAKAQADLIRAERSRETERLSAQQEALKEASAASKKEHEWQVQHLKNQNKYLEAENKAEELKGKLERARSDKKKAEYAAEIKRLEAQAAADKRRALQEEKQHKREEELAKKQEELLSYSKGDIFKDALLDANAEKGNSGAAEKIADENLMNTIKGVGKAITEGLNAINNSIKSYASHQTAINSRLQGISSYSKAVDKLENVAFSPLLKAEDLYSNLADLVGQGIATNVEQRAFFATTKDGIAQTFDVTDDSLRRIIRLQREDSTAARLGLEAYLNKFLNTYVENTEYLTTTFDNVASSLFEASAMLGKASGAGASAEFEYVVQKWLGTLVGLGFSESSAQNIAGALGQLGSGDVSGLAGSSAQNLLVMAASKMNKSYADMLLEGLNAQDVNDLMKGIVLYLQELGTYNTNVVKNQLSDIFGVTVSDLVAVGNLAEENLAKVHADMLSMTDMYNELKDQYGDLPGRVGISNILDNLFANLNYQTGQSIAGNPALFAAWKITDLIQGVTGGINIPYISAMGNGFGLETTVENLIKLGIVGISTIGNIGKIIGGIASVGDGAALLGKLGITSGVGEVKTFGGSLSATRDSGKSLSEGAYVGNTDSDAYADSALNEANDDGEKKLQDRKNKEGNPMKKTEDILLDIYAEVSTISMLALLGSHDPASLKYTAGSGATPAKLAFTIGETLLGGQIAYDVALDADAISTLLGNSSLGIKVKQLAGDGSSQANNSTGNTSNSSGAGSSSSAGQIGASEFSPILDAIAATTDVIGTNFETLFEKLDNYEPVQQTTVITSELTTIKNTTDRIQAVSDINTEILTEIRESTVGSITPGITSNDNSTYLAAMEFSSSFNTLVADVARIAKKYLEETPSNSAINSPGSSGSLSGFTQYEF